MEKNIIFKSKFNGKKYRIVTYIFYNYFDELAGDEETDLPPIFRNAYTEVQVRKRILFIPYWRTIKEYISKNRATIHIQEYNATKWYYKNIENNG